MYIVTNFYQMINLELIKILKTKYIVILIQLYYSNN